MFRTVLSHPPSLAKLAGITFGLLFTAILHAPSVHAATYTLTPGSPCTLADAITAIDTTAVKGSCAAGAGDGSDQINLGAGTYTLNTDLPAITKTVVIDGAGVGSTIIDGGNTHAMFTSEISGKALIMSDLTLTHIGSNFNGNAGISMLEGTLQNLVIRDSAAAFAGLVVNTPSGQTSNIENVAVLNMGGYGVFVYPLGGTVNISNVTSTGNTTGVYLQDGGSNPVVNITNATIAGNSNGDSTQPAGILISNMNTGMAVNVKNTILANDTSAGTSSNCGNGTFGSYSMSLPTSQGHNIVSDGTCGFVGTSNHTNTDPGLGALTAVNGTYVFPITGASAAWDAGDNTGAPGIDQRGTSRPKCSAVDIGAYETTDCNAPAAPSGGSGSAKTSTGTTSAGTTTAPDAATKSATAPDTTGTADNSLNSGEDVAATPDAKTHKSSHASLVWLTVAIMLITVGSAGWIWLYRHPKLLKKHRK